MSLDVEDLRNLCKTILATTDLNEAMCLENIMWRERFLGDFLKKTPAVTKVEIDLHAFAWNAFLYTSSKDMVDKGPHWVLQEIIDAKTAV